MKKIFLYFAVLAILVWICMRLILIGLYFITTHLIWRVIWTYFIKNNNIYVFVSIFSFNIQNLFILSKRQADLGGTVRQPSKWNPFVRKLIAIYYNTLLIALWVIKTIFTKNSILDFGRVLNPPIWFLIFDKYFLCILVKGISSSNVNEGIRAVLTFLRKDFTRTKSTKTHISKQKHKRQCFYALKKHLRGKKLLIHLFAFLCFLCAFCAFCAFYAFYAFCAFRACEIFL